MSARNKKGFHGTLDYIWLSQEWGVRSVTKLPSLAELTSNGTKSLPTLTEPSDHLMIGAELTLS